MESMENGFVLATSPTDTPVELYVLRHKLQICSYDITELTRFVHAIIKISLLESSSPQFFSFTETGSEFTLVLPEEEVENFPYGLRTSGKTWRAITVSAGAIVGFVDLAGVSKIAKAVISPLADCGITVFCISTYQSDFILVQEADLSQAIECLGKRFKIFDENHAKIGGPKRGAMMNSIFTDLKKNSVISKPLYFPSEDYYVTGISPSNLSKVTQTMLELMFFPTKNMHPEMGQIEAGVQKELFFHFSVIDGDVSFILDEDSLSKFPPNTIYHPSSREKWKIIHVGDSPLGFDETGIVSNITEPLAAAQISIYYISTFDYDHALVPEGEIGTVKALLEKSWNITNGSGPCDN